MGKKSGSGRLRDEQPGSYFLELRNDILGVKILIFFDADPGWKKFGSGMEKSRIRDPGSGKISRIRNTDKHKQTGMLPGPSVESYPKILQTLKFYKTCKYER
jgi:hypothetical protein